MGPMGALRNTGQQVRVGKGLAPGKRCSQKPSLASVRLHFSSSLRPMPPSLWVFTYVVSRKWPLHNSQRRLVPGLCRAISLFSSQFRIPGTETLMAPGQVCCAHQVRELGVLGATPRLYGDAWREGGPQRKAVASWTDVQENLLGAGIDPTFLFLKLLSSQKREKEDLATLSVKPVKAIANLYLDSVSRRHRFQASPRADASPLPRKGRDRGPFGGVAAAKPPPFPGGFRGSCILSFSCEEGSLLRRHFLRATAQAAGHGYLL